MDTQWIMAFKDKPCGKNDINCKDYYKKSIYITENGGETWRSALNYVRDASWYLISCIVGTSCCSINSFQINVSLFAT